MLYAAQSQSHGGVVAKSMDHERNRAVVSALPATTRLFTKVAMATVAPSVAVGCTSSWVMLSISASYTK